MKHRITPLLLVFAFVAPLGLAACQSHTGGGDEHAGEEAESSEHAGDEAE
jgi:hypothetical protein